ncbi:MAG: hypothetical protein AAFY72_05940 [Cyanobacteria bacterium J06649_4]
MTEDVLNVCLYRLAVKKVRISADLCELLVIKISYQDLDGVHGCLRLYKGILGDYRCARWLGKAAQTKFNLYFLPSDVSFSTRTVNSQS